MTLPLPPPSMESVQSRFCSLLQQIEHFDAHSGIGDWIVGGTLNLFTGRHAHRLRCEELKVQAQEILQRVHFDIVEGRGVSQGLLQQAYDLLEEAELEWTLFLNISRDAAEAGAAVAEGTVVAAGAVLVTAATGGVSLGVSAILPSAAYGLLWGYDAKMQAEGVTARSLREGERNQPFAPFLHRSPRVFQEISLSPIYDHPQTGNADADHKLQELGREIRESLQKYAEGHILLPTPKEVIDRLTRAVRKEAVPELHGAGLGEHIVAAELIYEQNPRAQAFFSALATSWRKDAEDLRKQIKDVEGEDQRVIAVMQWLFERGIGSYRRDKAQLKDFWQFGALNCEGRVKLIMAAMEMAGVKVAAPRTFAVEVFADHVQLVVYNHKTGEVWDLLSGERSVSHKGALYDVRILYHALLRGMGAHPVVPEDALKLADESKGSLTGKGSVLTNTFLRFPVVRSWSGIEEVPEFALSRNPYAGDEMVQGQTPSIVARRSRLYSDLPETLNERDSERAFRFLNDSKDDDPILSFRDEHVRNQYDALRTSSERYHFLLSLLLEQDRAVLEDPRLGRVLHSFSDPSAWSRFTSEDAAYVNQLRSALAGVLSLRHRWSGGCPSYETDSLPPCPEVDAMLAQIDSAFLPLLRDPRISIEAVTSLTEEKKMTALSIWNDLYSSLDGYFHVKSAELLRQATVVLLDSMVPEGGWKSAQNDPPVNDAPLRRTVVLFGRNIPHCGEAQGKAYAAGVDGGLYCLADASVTDALSYSAGVGSPHLTPGMTERDWVLLSLALRDEEQLGHVWSPAFSRLALELMHGSNPSFLRSIEFTFANNYFTNWNLLFTSGRYPARMVPVPRDLRVCHEDDFLCEGFLQFTARLGHVLKYPAGSDRGRDEEPDHKHARVPEDIIPLVRFFRDQERERHKEKR